MKLPRPYIPVDTRIQVAHRQYYELFHMPPTCIFRLSKSEWLAQILRGLFGDQKVELHHRPALLNRTWVRHWIKGKGETITYTPDANDPAYLIYLPKHEHEIETRVRGQGAQLSDLAIARKRKRMEKKRGQTGTVVGVAAGRVRGGGLNRVNRKPSVKRKYKWPSRKLQSRPFSRRP